MNYKERYNFWLENADGETAAELEAIKNDDAEIYDRFYKETEFGTGGMRGVMGAGYNRINRYTIGRATEGFARYIIKNEGAAEKGIAIAHDNRRGGRLFAEVTAGVLAAKGIKVYLFEDLRRDGLSACSRSGSGGN